MGEKEEAMKCRSYITEVKISKQVLELNRMKLRQF